MIRVPVWPGELGLKLVYHAPAVFALPGEYECEVEAGEEALYPGAVRHIIVPRASDDQRAGGKHWRGQPVGSDSPKRYFVPEPHVRADIRTDVVICPRKRTYGAAKNWPAWRNLAAGLHAAGLDVFAAGSPDASETQLWDGKWQPDAAWEYLRFLDASIEAIRSAKLVIATDAGLAFLALLCGTPLLLITHHGRTAPGAQLDVHGRAMQPNYPAIRWDRYNGANHTKSPIIECPTGWERPSDVLALALATIGERKAAA